MWTLINANKTKLIGALIAVLSFVQANPALKDLMSEQAYSWLMFGIGCVVVFFGFLNNPPIAPHKEGQ